MFLDSGIGDLTFFYLNGTFNFFRLLEG